MKAKRFIIWTAAILAVLFVATEIVISAVVMHSMLDKSVVHSQFWQAEKYGLPAPDTLRLTSSDGIDLEAYMVSPAAPKAVVICLTGIQNPSVTCYWGHAEMFYQAGYASVLLEVRGHAPSGGDRICAGYQEPRDVKAVTDYLKSDTRFADVPVVVLGLSMGGGVAINSIGTNDDIDALVSISAYSSLEDMFVEYMKGQAPNVLTYCIKPFMRLTATCRYGVNARQMRPKTMIRHLDGRPALLMHSRGDTEVSFANFERIVAVAPEVQTLVREGDEHFFIEDFLTPQSYTLYSTTLMNFLASVDGK